VDPALFLSAAISMHPSILPPHVLRERPRSGSQVMSSMPHSCSTPPFSHPSHFGSSCSLFWRSNAGQKSPSPLPRPAWRSGHSGTLQETTGGTQIHSRRTGSKLGRLHRARQAIVRVPESNTKYGANWGKQEGAEPSDLAQVSVSPERFPRENICFGAADLEFAPLFTGQLYFVLQGAFGGCSGKTHVRLR
jgi:hypothetical protein